MTTAAPAIKTSRKPWPIVAAVVVLALLGWFGYRALSPANTAPAATFTLLSGEKVSTTDLKGKVYMINFWATSCATCVKEMPDMVRTYEQFKGKGLEFVAVAMNYDPPMYVMNYARTRDLPFKVAMDSDGAAAKPRQCAADADHLRGRQGRPHPEALCGRARVGCAAQAAGRRAGKVRVTLPAATAAKRCSSSTFFCFYARSPGQQVARHPCMDIQLAPAFSEFSEPSPSPACDFGPSPRRRPRGRP